MALISEQGHESNGKTHHHHRGQSAAGKRGHLTVRRVTAHRSHLKHTADPSLAPSRQQSNLNAQRDINAVVEGCTKCAPRPIPAMDSRMSGPTLRVEAKTFNKKACTPVKSINCAGAAAVKKIMNGTSSLDNFPVERDHGPPLDNEAETVGKMKKSESGEVVLEEMQIKQVSDLKKAEQVETSGTNGGLKAQSNSKVKMVGDPVNAKDALGSFLEVAEGNTEEPFLSSANFHAHLEKVHGGAFDRASPAAGGNRGQPRMGRRTRGRIAQIVHDVKDAFAQIAALAGGASSSADSDWKLDSSDRLQGHAELMALLNRHGDAAVKHAEIFLTGMARTPTGSDKAAFGALVGALGSFSSEEAQAALARVTQATSLNHGHSSLSRLAMTALASAAQPSLEALAVLTTLAKDATAHANVHSKHHAIRMLGSMVGTVHTQWPEGGSPQAVLANELTDWMKHELLGAVLEAPTSHGINVDDLRLKVPTDHHHAHAILTGIENTGTHHFLPALVAILGAAPPHRADDNARATAAAKADRKSYLAARAVGKTVPSLVTKIAAKNAENLATSHAHLHGGAKLRQGAVMALKRIPGPVVDNVLVRLVEDKNETRSMQRLALEALGHRLLPGAMVVRLARHWATADEEAERELRPLRDGYARIFQKAVEHHRLVDRSAAAHLKHEARHAEAISAWTAHRPDTVPLSSLPADTSDFIAQRHNDAERLAKRTGAPAAVWGLARMQGVAPPHTAQQAASSSPLPSSLPSSLPSLSPPVLTTQLVAQKATTTLAFLEERQEDATVSATKRKQNTGGDMDKSERSSIKDKAVALMPELIKYIKQVITSDEYNPFIKDFFDGASAAIDDALPDPSLIKLNTFLEVTEQYSRNLDNVLPTEMSEITARATARAMNDVPDDKSKRATDCTSPKGSPKLECVAQELLRLPREILEMFKEIRRFDFTRCIPQTETQMLAYVTND